MASGYEAVTTALWPGPVPLSQALPDPGAGAGICFRALGLMRPRKSLVTAFPRAHAIPAAIPSWEVGCLLMHSVHRAELASFLPG